MAVDYWHDMSILEGGLELAGHGKNVDVQVAVNPLDTTALNTTGFVALIGGLKSTTVSLSLMADPTIDADLWANLGASDVVRSIIKPVADGSVAYTMRGIGVQYSPVQGNVGEVAMSQSTAAGSGVAVRGKLLHPSSVARTSSSTGTARELGAVVEGKRMYAALHVLAVTGTSPTLDVIVQSDTTGFGSPTSRITFPQTGVVGAQWGSVDGPVTDDFWRISYTIGGTDTPSFVFAVVAGLL